MSSSVRASFVYLDVVEWPRIDCWLGVAAGLVNLGFLVNSRVPSLDTERPFADAADNDGLNGPSLVPRLLDPHLGSRMKSLFGFGAIDSLCNSGLLTPPLLQTLLELFIRFWAFR